jgi:putative tryptophan/tyrosine transport system substrate-binding protein
MPRAAGTALEQRLGQLGWIEGRTIAIERRWADARNSRLPKSRRSLFRLKVDVIIELGTA